MLRVVGYQKHPSDTNSLEVGIIKNDIFRIDIHKEAAHFRNTQNANGFLRPDCARS